MSADSDLLVRVKHLLHRGANTVDHSDGDLLNHLLGTRNILVRWGARPTVLDAGLFHSVYGTDKFSNPIYLASERELLQEAIGVESEWLVYLFCARERISFVDTLAIGPPYSMINRFNGARLQLSSEVVADLALVEAANVLEQLPRVNFEHRQRGFELLRRISTYLTGSSKSEIESIASTTMHQ